MPIAFTGDIALQQPKPLKKAAWGESPLIIWVVSKIGTLGGRSWELDRLGHAGSTPA